MKKFLLFVGAIIAVFMSCFMVACTPTVSPETKPLQVEDCFKDFVQVSYFRYSYINQGYENVPFTGDETENVSLSKLLKQDSNISAAKYSDFKIFTTSNASKIRVKSIQFDIVTVIDCNVQFSLQLSKNVVRSGATVSVKGGEPATVSFTEIGKGWTADEAGKSELVSGLMKGTEETYLLISLLNKNEMLDNDYYMNNLQIEFEEIK